MADRRLQSVVALYPPMRRQGIRRLLVLSGDARWCGRQAHRLTKLLAGDWLWLGDTAELANHCLPAACHTLAGREIHHAIVDARYQLDVRALAVLAGTLVAGSFLVLLTPGWDHWSQMADNDSRRWNDGEPPCPTPNFIRHLQHCLAQDSEVLIYQPHSLRFAGQPARPDWQPASGQPLAQQQAILAQLLAMPAGVALVSAPRGRGKSALAGMLIASQPGQVVVTAPARIATQVITVHARRRFTFLAPDALLSAPPAADWLIIDEAAVLSGAQLQQLIRLYPRTLLTTTVQGYEGTGRGFLLKFCAGIDGLRHYRLTQPVRWAINDPLERLISQALFLDDDADADYPVTGNTSDNTSHDTHNNKANHRDCLIFPVSQRHWITQPQQMAQVYRLLTAAHYRTSPLDLRRMMDAARQRFVIACINNQVIGALWLVEEGGLSPALSQAVWAGVRRPPGNLVAQSLAAHGGCPQAACLRGLRISRIAVHPRYQRQGIGQRLIAHARASACDDDYLSVSFGYTPSLWRFWHYCGFRLARFGSKREASSGCYNAIALYPLSEAGQRLAQHEHNALLRDGRWLQPFIDETLPVPDSTAAPDQSLNSDDWLTLAGFAFARRPLETSLGALNRLLQNHLSPLPLLHARLQTATSVSQLCHNAGLSGRKALLAALREETATALGKLDTPRCLALRQQISDWQSV